MTNARFALNETTRVFDENDEEIQPGSDAIGMIGNGGYTPIAYYKDPEKSARTSQARSSLSQDLLAAVLAASVEASAVRAELPGSGNSSA